MLDRVRLTRTRIMVAGDAMTGRCRFGTSERISQEVPGSSTRIEDAEERGGRRGGW